MDPELAPEAADITGFLRRLGAVLRDARGKAVPGSALLLAAAARRHGIPVAGPALEEAAAFLGLSPAHLERVVAFCGELATGSVTVCHGVNCTVRGAPALHAALGAQGVASDPARPWTRVHCLDRCDRGPSFMVGKRIYCAGSEEIGEDQRPWRQGNAVPGEDSASSRA